MIALEDRLGGFGVQTRFKPNSSECIRESKKENDQNSTALYSGSLQPLPERSEHYII